MIENEQIQTSLQSLFAKHGITDQEMIERITLQQKNFESYMQENDKTTYTTLFAEFGIADLPAFSGEYPEAAIRETYLRVSQETISDEKQFAELFWVLESRGWTWHLKGYDKLADLYYELITDVKTKAIQKIKKNRFKILS